MCIWSVEADIFDFNSETILDILYRNNYVDSFMNEEDSMGIAACKGMGKTFLLKSKRIRMMKRWHSKKICVKAKPNRQKVACNTSMI